MERRHSAWHRHGKHSPRHALRSSCISDRHPYRYDILNIFLSLLLACEILLLAVGIFTLAIDRLVELPPKFLLTGFLLVCALVLFLFACFVASFGMEMGLKAAVDTSCWLELWGILITGLVVVLNVVIFFVR